jgi:hypothetical protein
MSEAETEQPLLGLAEPLVVLPPADLEPPVVELQTFETPLPTPAPAKPATKRRSPRKPTKAKKDEAEAPAKNSGAAAPGSRSVAVSARKMGDASVMERPARPSTRKRRRSAMAIPALLDPILIPEDAEGRVEFIVQPLPVRPPSPAAKKTRAKRKPKSQDDVPGAGSVPWSIVAAIGLAMIVLFAIGVLITR